MRLIIINFRIQLQKLAKLNYQQPLLQSSVSHDPSEIILYANLVLKNDIIIIIIIIVVVVIIIKSSTEFI